MSRETQYNLAQHLRCFPAMMAEIPHCRDCGPRPSLLLDTESSRICPAILRVPVKCLEPNTQKTGAILCWPSSSSPFPLPFIYLMQQRWSFAADVFLSGGGWSREGSMKCNLSNQLLWQRLGRHFL